ncbi:hypothetical protein [Anaerolentibacter hominis]|uniref:hypothetical protein n=1 Tax=Anaerolentibacter hominis TaxID=3079009 RepID=UPI0031B88F1E
MRRKIQIVFCLLAVCLLSTGCANLLLKHKENVQKELDVIVWDVSATYLLAKPLNSGSGFRQADLLQISTKELDGIESGDRIRVTYTLDTDSAVPMEITADNLTVLMKAEEQGYASNSQMFATYLRSDESNTVVLLTEDKKTVTFYYSDLFLDQIAHMNQGDTLLFSYGWSDAVNEYEIRSIIASETAGPEMDIRIFIALLDGFDREKNEVGIDWVEWLTDKSMPRLMQLGIDPKRSMPDGFYIYNEKEVSYPYPLSENLTIKLTEKVARRQVPEGMSRNEYICQLLSDRKRACRITIVDGEIIQIEEMEYPKQDK